MLPTARTRATTWLAIYSNIMLISWGVFFLALFIFNTLQYHLFLHSISTMMCRFLIPMILGGLFLYTVRCHLQTRLVVANSLLAIIAALYSGEFYLAHRLDVMQQRASQAVNQPFDKRDKLAVIRDLRTSHINAYPVMRAENLLVADDQGTLRPLTSVNGKPLLPLASIPGAVVVSCNESGQWQIYQTDRHGFNNPDEQWDLQAEIGMVGDSFAHGSCVPREQNMATLLNTQFGSVLNLGVGGFGPLLELAALTEYIQPLQPPVVLWMFFEGNDLNEDLPREIKSPLLLDYLHNENFRQDLIHRAGDVKLALGGYMDQRLTEAMSLVDGPYENFVRYLTLDRLREAVGVGPLQIGYNFGDMGSEFTLFSEILEKADQRVRKWGGRLYLVYLPESDRYLSRFGNSVVRQNIYQGVMNIAMDKHIPFIDVAAAFAHDPDPATLFAYPGAHFSPRGYSLAASTITRTLAPIIGKSR